MLSFLETVPDVEFDIYGGQQLAANDNNRRSVSRQSCVLKFIVSRVVIKFSVN